MDDQLIQNSRMRTAVRFRVYGELDFVRAGGQVVGEHYGSGIMEPLAVTVVKIDASLSFAVDCEFQGSCVRTGADEGSDGLASNLRRMGLPGVSLWSKGRPRYLVRFPPGRSFHSGSENFHAAAWGGFGKGTGH